MVTPPNTRQLSSPKTPCSVPGFGQGCRKLQAFVNFLCGFVHSREKPGCKLQALAGPQWMFWHLHTHSWAQQPVLHRAGDRAAALLSTRVKRNPQSLCLCSHSCHDFSLAARWVLVHDQYSLLCRIGTLFLSLITNPLPFFLTCFFLRRAAHT